MRMTEQKPGFDNLEREAEAGGLPPMPGPPLSGDSPESSDPSDLSAFVRDLLDKYGEQLGSLCTQTLIDQLTAIANGEKQLEETTRIRQKFGFEVKKPQHTRTKYESVRFADSLR